MLLCRVGAVYNGVCTGGPWSRRETSLTINALELKAAFLTLHSFADFLTNLAIALLLGNASAVCYINILGGTQLKLLAIEATWPSFFETVLLVKRNLSEYIVCSKYIPNSRFCVG